MSSNNVVIEYFTLVKLDYRNLFLFRFLLLLGKAGSAKHTGKKTRIMRHSRMSQDKQHSENTDSAKCSNICSSYNYVLPWANMNPVNLLHYQYYTTVLVLLHKIVIPYYIIGRIRAKHVDFTHHINTSQICVQLCVMCIHLKAYCHS